ncbi:MAG: excinuclease ABC subunit UvrC [Clostridiales bacterium]|jgi:excinuclease ABC subunit C|nr:excinuclease ABC subunit UvrC [Clostridiales bacterium]
MSLEEKIKDLPTEPGVYVMRNAGGDIIYIGKAVVLKNRVRQYFSTTPKAPKVRAMVDNIADFEYIITLSEKDALTLEANLIKKYKPRYNILLKDDKASPYIRIDLREPFPTPEITRRVKRDGAKYFGPYFGGVRVSDVLDIIRAAYRMRTCPKKLTRRKRECLNYHIGLCLGPCRGRVDEETYAETVRRVIAFLSGRDDSAERLIEEKMLAAAKNEDFERAAVLRDRLAMLKDLKARTVTELNAGADIDSFAYATDGVRSAVSVAVVRGGKMMGVKNFIITDAELKESDALSAAVAQYYGGGAAVPDEIALGDEFDASALSGFLSTLTSSRVEVVFPKIGVKKKLVAMAKKNADDYLVKSVQTRERELDMTARAADNLARILGVASCRRMECYDISHISGTDKVASGVTFLNGEPCRSEYRRYKIKTVEGSDDFACLAEVLARRLKRANDGDEKFSELPDLIIIDGGKGQLSSAYESLKGSGFNIDMISLAKRDEEVFTVGNPEPLLLAKSSYPLRLLQRIRDEAHRFAITYHRSTRAKRYASVLDGIRGVGPKKRKILLERFESVGAIGAADLATLEAIDGIDRRTAKAVKEFFENRSAGK